MHRHNLFEILQTFNDSELERFKYFLQSPFFNRKTKVNLLYDAIIKHHPKYDDDRLSKQNLFHEIYPGRKYNDSTMRNLLSGLYLLLKEYLSYEDFKRREIEAEFCFLNELKRRNILSLIGKRLKVIEKLLGECGEIDYDFLMYKNRLEAHKFNFRISYSKAVKIKSINNLIESLTDSQVCLTTALITEVISDHLNLLILSHKYNLNEAKKRAYKILEMFNFKKIYGMIKGREGCSMILDLYLRLYRMYCDFENLDAYREYKTFVEENIRRLSYDERSFHYSKLISYCVMKLNLDVQDKGHKAELFELYETLLKNGYYKNKKTENLPASLFRDIFVIMLRLGFYKWVERFINLYYSKVDPSERKNMYNLGYAHLSFALGKYRSVYKYLNHIESTNVIYKYDINVLTLKLYLEEMDYKYIPAYIRKFRQNIEDDCMIPPPRKLRYSNFIKFYGMIFRLEENTVQADTDFLKYKILRTKEIHEKEWLLERTDRLQNCPSLRSKLRTRLLDPRLRTSKSHSNLPVFKAR